MIRLLLSEPDDRARLRLVGVLRDNFKILLPDPGEDPLRAFRRHRPDLMLMVLPRRQLSVGLRCCRAIKTSLGHQPRLGLMDPWRRIDDPAALLTACMGDGYLGGVPDDQEMRAFVRELQAGTEPVIHLHKAAGRRLGWLRR